MECISRVFRCVEGRVSEDCKNTCFVHVYEREEIRISVQITRNEFIERAWRCTVGTVDNWRGKKDT